jgi:hypothetical protein
MSTFERCASAGLVVAALMLAGCGGATLAPTLVSRSSAVLNGKAACAGSACSWYFRYGTNNRYQNRTHVQSARTDTGGVEVSLPGSSVGGLTPGTTYQYQLCGGDELVGPYTCVGPDGTPNTSQQFRTQDSKANCIYTSNNVSTLVRFGELTHYHYRCAVTFANTNTQWASWEVPWFTTQGHPIAEYYNWQDWKNCAYPGDRCAAGEKRQLIITLELWPSSEDGNDPLSQCARGNYNQHAVNLATNLVSDGLGDSIIRLQHEGNATGDVDDLPTDGPGGWPTRQEELEWALCWSNEARAMKSVPEAHFLTDWTINAYWRPIPLADWYPGDSAVDVIGIDAYESGLPSGITSEPSAWDRVYSQADGIRTVQQFAALHGKPVSFPEWGLSFRGSPDFGLGDDPIYVDAMAFVLHGGQFAYQSYFLNHDSAAVLLGQDFSGSDSLTRYIAHFGGIGDTRGNPTVTP